MTAFTDNAENLLLNFLFRAVTNSPISAPSAWYVGLHTADPTESGTTAELSGNGYARKSVTFAAPSGGAVTNTADLVFGPNTTSAWGTVSHISVWDALTSGNALMKGALSASVPVAVNDSLKIAAGALSLQVD